MTLVTAQMSVSLDGFYSGPEHVDAGFHRVTRWVIDAYAWRQRQGFEGGEQSVDSDLIEEMFQATGAYVMGRRMFDTGEVPWGETPPFRAPVFVVTHRARPPLVRKGGTTFTFVTDGVDSAIARARAAADGRNVAVAGGGDLLRQVLAAGLLDELELHISPVLLGAGMRLFPGRGSAEAPARVSRDAKSGALDHDAIELAPTRVIDTPEVTHVRYRVDGPAALTADDRGAGVEVRS
jgi:dihydrofolate reductase